MRSCSLRACDSHTLAEPTDTSTFCNRFGSRETARYHGWRACQTAGVCARAGPAGLEAMGRHVETPQGDRARHGAPHRRAGYAGRPDSPTRGLCGDGRRSLPDSLRVTLRAAPLDACRLRRVCSAFVMLRQARARTARNDCNMLRWRAVWHSDAACTCTLVCCS